MNRILGILLFYFACMPAYSQQAHFVYIQSDNKQGFYVRLNNKTYSSSASGYLILSKLKEGDIDITVGFPQHAYPEQHFIITIGKEDLGYNLKDFGDKGWGLFNLQTLSITYHYNKDEKKALTKKEEKADAFSDMLVQVTGDSSIKESVTVKEQKTKPQTQVKADTVSAKINDMPQEPVQPIDPTPKVNLKDATIVMDTINKEIKSIVPDKEVIRKVTEFSNDETLSMIYLISNAGRTDTVNVIIELADAKEKMKTDSAEKKPVVQFLDVKVDSVIQKPETPKTEALLPVVRSTRVNADCGNVATDDDFKKLRKKMASQANDDDMIYEARKAFRLKCYSSEQIKNLGSLFLTDAGRYGFYDAAYPRVYDQEKFAELSDQLKDEYYKNRFKAMLRE